MDKWAAQVCMSAKVLSACLSNEACTCYPSNCLCVRASACACVCTFVYMLVHGGVCCVCRRGPMLSCIHPPFELCWMLLIKPSSHELG